MTVRARRTGRVLLWLLVTEADQVLTMTVDAGEHLVRDGRRLPAPLARVLAGPLVAEVTAVLTAARGRGPRAESVGAGTGPADGEPLVLRACPVPAPVPQAVADPCWHVVTVSEAPVAEVDVAEVGVAVRAGHPGSTEARLREALDGVPQIVWTADADGSLDYLNPRWEEFTGDLGGPTALHPPLVHPDESEAAHRAWEEARRLLRPHRAEYRLRHRSGDYRWVESRAVPIRDGDRVRWCGSITDIDDRKGTERALVAGQARLRRIFDAVPVSILELDWSAVLEQVTRLRDQGVTDPRAHLTGDPEAIRRLRSALLVSDANLRARQVLGDRPVSELSQVLADAFATPDGERVLGAVVGEFAGGASAFTTELTVNDGDGRPTRQRIAFTFPSAGDSAGRVFAVMNDVTADAAALAEQERRRADLESLVAERTRELARAHRQVSDSEALLRVIADSIPALVGYWGPDQVCRFANKAYLEWFGRAPEYVLGRTMLDLMGPELYARSEPHILGALRGERQRFERTLEKPSGEIGYLLAHYVPHHVDGRLAGFVAAVADVTPVKTAHLRLEAANRLLQEERDRADTERLKFEELFERAPDATLLVAADGTVTRANAAAVKTFRLDPETSQGRLIEDFLPAEFRGVHREYRGRYLDDPVPRPMGATTFTAQRADGTQLKVQVSLGPLSTERNTMTIVTVRDVSELTLAYEQLKRSNQQLEETTLAQQQFIYIASHDLREPVNTISNFSRLLLEDQGADLDEQGRRFLMHIVDSAERMRQLLDDLLGYIRLDRTEVEFEPVALDEIVRQSAGDLSALVGERHARLVLHPLPVVQGQASLLRALVQNLLDNATKFRAPDRDPVVELSATVQRDEVEVVVADNGIGVEEAYLDRIFDIFRRLHPAHRYPGTGVGLAMCRRIVHLHHGAIWAQSTPGSGTEIHFTLRRQNPAPQSGSTPQAGSTPPASSTLEIPDE